MNIVAVIAGDFSEIKYLSVNHLRLLNIRLNLDAQ